MTVLSRIARTLCAGALAAMAMMYAHQAQALMIAAGYSVNVNSGHPGLAVQTQDIYTNPFAMDLTLGVAQTVDLFHIWTDETTVNPGEDNVASAASVTWSFTAPPGAGTSTGATNGGYGIFFIFPTQYGEVVWNNPATVSFSSGAELQISLSNERFNEGIFGLNPGFAHGAIVKATFLLTKDSSVSTVGNPGTTVPEPGGLALFSAGLLGMGLLLAFRRRTG